MCVCGVVCVCAYCASTASVPMLCGVFQSSDFFRGVEVTKIRLAGLDHVVSFVASEDAKIYIRIYQ